MMPEIDLRDLVYFDFEKAASIYSQVEGGLLKETQTGVEASQDKRRVHSFDLKFYKPEFGGISADKTSQLESRVLHHDLLTRVEFELGKLGVAVDLNLQARDSDLTTELIRSEIAGLSYLRAEGWSVIEDYSRFYEFTKRFNDLVEFLGKCSMSAIEQTEEFQQVLRNVETLRDKAKAEKDRNSSAKIRQEANRIESEFREQSKLATNAQPVPDWLLSGIRQYIDMFMSDRISLRVYPFESLPDFEIIANLKKDCFVDGDLENVLLAYGTRPNVKLTVFGLITSLPTADDTGFNPWDEFKKRLTSNASDEVVFEGAFRNMFSSMEGFEKFVRFARYPNVTVFPIAVYRSIRAPQSQGLVNERFEAINTPG